ncbi:hypothetical protein KGF56_004238 [Candida oxycetoniae]|uniref:Uncharacterized protein n=1 Tax=Candida oxycetoniae TaxID=497107 RepID=A0AAI9SU86_9ASCO|nr:uncharacterized protein KGF56_004238 [Candida oxycetoniae]KAI3402985.2 hypothetical protein KGF56_004238 [Candida oxycetoniae]
MFLKSSKTMMRPGLLLIRRSLSTAESYIRPKPKFWSLLKTPTTKSLILSLICTSVMIELLKSRREVQQLQASYQLRFQVLGEILTKLKNGENFDLKRELHLANIFTEQKYNSKTDIELDQQIEQLLKMSDEDLERLGDYENPKIITDKVEESTNVERKGNSGTFI